METPHFEFPQVAPKGCICPPQSERTCRNPICGRGNPDELRPAAPVIDRAITGLRIGRAFAQSEVDARGSSDRDYEIKAVPTEKLIRDALEELEAFAASLAKASVEPQTVDKEKA